MSIFTVILNFLGNIFVGIFNNAMKTPGETHEVKEDKTGLDDGRTAGDIANEFKLYDRHQDKD